MDPDGGLDDESPAVAERRTEPGAGQPSQEGTETVAVGSERLTEVGARHCAHRPRAVLPRRTVPIPGRASPTFVRGGSPMGTDWSKASGFQTSSPCQTTDSGVESKD
jgi:D-tyrosyl-tRNA(Tyr) deacylase